MSMEAVVETRSVLVIEDEPLISMDLCATLEDAGFAIVGPAYTVQAAIQLLQSERPSVAIVDLWLRDGPCIDVVHLLRARGVPFVVISGTGPDGYPASAFSGVPWLQKPADPNEVVALLSALSQERHHAR